MVHFDFSDVQELRVKLFRKGVTAPSDPAMRVLSEMDLAIASGLSTGYLKHLRKRFSEVDRLMKDMTRDEVGYT